MDILRYLNVAPTQISPNSWAFIRGFEILCKSLDMTPSAGAFFHFYGTKGVDKGSRVSISAQAGKSLFPSYASNFKKNWQVSFMKVCASKDSRISVASVDGELRFPVSWTSSPQSVCSYDCNKMTPYERDVVGFLDRMKLIDIRTLLNKETNSEDLEFYLREYFSFKLPVLFLFFNLLMIVAFFFFLFVVPMMPLAGKERRKYLAALKEKNASGEHIASDPANLLSRKRKKDQGVAAEAPGAYATEVASALNKGTSEDVIDLTASPQRNKARTGQKDAGKEGQLEKNAVAEVDAAYRQSFWHRDFQYHQYMEEHVPFAVVDEDVGFHAKFSDLAQDAGARALRSLVYMHSMERKYDALEKQLQESMKDVEKYKHKAAAFEERVEGLLLNKTKVEKAVSDLEKEKANWASEKGDFEKKVGDLEEELAIAKEEVENCKMAMVGQFEEGFERAKSQLAFLFPELDLSSLDSLKIVQEGELVDEP